MNNGLKKGDRVSFTNRDRKMLSGVYQHIAPNGKAYIKGDDGRAYEREVNKLIKIQEAETDFKVNQQLKTSNDTTETTTKFQPKNYDINDRFKFLEKLVYMVVNKSCISMIVTGEGGLGKTYTVRKCLEIKRRLENEDWIHIKGFSTARGLFRTLYENSDKLVVFDDCDSILDDKIAVNILKSALDSYDERTIHWITRTVDESLPDSFEFTGEIIFISNKSQEQIDQAILSRSTSIDLTMSVRDKIERMKNILPSIKPSVALSLKQECLDLIEQYKDFIKDLNIRTLIKIINMRVDPENGEEWKDMAIYSMIHTVN